MARKNPVRLEFDALSIEGGLFPAEWLAKVAATEASAQSSADYGVPKGLALRDEIGRYWRIAQALWRDFDVARGTTAGAEGVLATRAFLKQFLSDVLGFTDLVDGKVHEIDERRFPIGFEASSGRVPIIVGAPSEGLDDSVPRHGDGNRRRSAFGAVQEYLNASDTALWGLACNGTTLRLVRDNASLTRPAWVEADLARIFAEERYADFAAFWLLTHASRFGRAGNPASECTLELWRSECQQQGSRAREALRNGVEAAILALGQGFLSHPANRALRQGLADGTLTRDAYFNELLRCVYRMIFLLTIEERELLFRPDATDDAKRLYGEGYGMRRLRERAVRRNQHDRHGDLWASLLPVFSALGQADGEPTLGLPGLGGLFASDQCPHLAGAALDNRALLGAVYRLAWIREQEGGTLARVNWKDMGPEELGSVYESLLELVPVVSDDGRRFSFAGVGESAGNARKLSGSYYTPDALVQQLLDTALEPVVVQRTSECATTSEKELALLSLTVVDPACGSGHFLLAASRRLASHLARLRAGGTPGASEYRHALRDVVSHCIHGVDRNPMALELARMALWLEAYTPDRALGFLDHHLVCGDALLGLHNLAILRDGIPDAAFRPLEGDDANITRTLSKANKGGKRTLEARRRSGQLALDLGATSWADAFSKVENLVDDDVAHVEDKRKKWSELADVVESSRAAIAADLFVAAFLVPRTLPDGTKALGEREILERWPTSAALQMVLDGELSAGHSIVSAARRSCLDAKVLHWPLAFPQVFARGGFDVVIGNPPWERIAIQDTEFFATSAPHIASIENTARRKAQIEELANDNPQLLQEYLAAKARAEVLAAFFQGSTLYTHGASGRLNTYPLFVERAASLVSGRGSVGIVVPSGILLDAPMEEMCSWLLTDFSLGSFIDFENRHQIFRGVHPSTRFCLLTFSRSKSNATALRLAVGLLDTSALTDPRRTYSISTASLRLVSPNTLQPLVARTQFDFDLAERIYRKSCLMTPKAGEGVARAWVGMTSSSHSKFLTDVDGRVPRGFVPVYEGKLVHQFDSRFGSFAGCSSKDRSSGKCRDVSPSEKADPICPRSALERDVAEEFLRDKGVRTHWIGVIRDYCRTTDERTAIAAVIPRMPMLQPLNAWTTFSDDPRATAAVLAVLNSLALDFVARQRFVGNHLNVTTFGQLPYPKELSLSDSFVVERVLELTFTSSDLGDWARALGHAGGPFPWDEQRRAQLRAELDAYIAHAFGLDRDALRYVIDPSDLCGPDYPSETFRVLKEREIREYGEYRTQRLVLQAWDRLYGR